ncbi:hypothetical protein O9H85_33615 [Paenibacillus filicis]|uniref:Uncharacterized protein n=1 Tax=Paenibacillus gyeongsangnamensis TaxID=3388067 RepID=A0ABT4QJZ8_9BACL|nr:hypothetical protein [Paenibacillus filicis]MCZ8517202.1 hypothetical protein [Paenibacillus filicis]
MKKARKICPLAIISRSDGKRRFTLLAVTAVLMLSVCSGFLLYQPLMVASGFTSHQICSETFVSGLNSDQIYADMVKPTGAIRFIDSLMRYNVDREKREVTTTVAGMYKTQAVYGEGMGCLLVHEPEDVNLATAADFNSTVGLSGSQAPEIAGPAVVGIKKLLVDHNNVDISGSLCWRS